MNGEDPEDPKVPAEEVPEEEAEPQAPPEEDQEGEPEGPDPEERLQTLEGRFRELETRYKESSKEGRRLFEENRHAQERERALLQALEARQRSEAPDPNEAVRQTLSERGVPEEAVPVIVDLIRREGAQAAAHEVRQLMDPLLRTWEAQGRLETEFGEYPRREILRYLDENPTAQARYESMLRADPLGAHEYALLKYREATGQRGEAELEAESEEVNQMKREARKTGRVVTPRGSRERRDSGQVESADRIAARLEKLREDAVMAKDPTRYIRERIKYIPSFSKIKWADADE